MKNPFKAPTHGPQPVQLLEAARQERVRELEIQVVKKRREERALMRKLQMAENQRAESVQQSNKEFIDSVIRQLRGDMTLVKKSLAEIHEAAKKEADTSTNE